VDSSTKQLNPLESDVQPSALSPAAAPTPQSVETPSNSQQPATNTFRQTAVTSADLLAPDANDIHPGTLVDGYVVIKTIARTKMSVVYQARQPGTGQMVALKLIQHGILIDQESIDRFQREIKALGQLQPHKNIVPIYHVGKHRNELYYVMPFLAGGNLAKQVARFQADRRKAVALVEKIARAVHQLHTNQPKILHRDIKPGNILLGADDEPLLADFGLIKMLDGNHALTHTHSRPGTPLYMAPEQTGLVPTAVNERSDIWALGVVLYELLTGARPFAKADEEDTSKLLWRIVNEAPPSPCVLQPDLDRALEPVVAKCLAKAPAERFGSAEELANELGRWLRGEALQTKPVSPMRRFAYRFRWVAAGVALIAVAAMIAAVVRDRNSPEAMLEALNNEFKQTGKIDLVPEMGRPRWQRLAMEADVDTSGRNGGYWEIQAPDLGLIELLPEAPPGAYRVHAEIAQPPVNPKIGHVGIFVVHQAYSTDPKVRHSWCNLTFNDAVEQLPNPKAGQLPGNTAQLQSRVFADTGVFAPIDHQDGWVKPVRFKPALVGVRWRTLEIDVYPDCMVGRFDGEEMAPLNRALIVRVTQKNLADAQQSHPARYVPLGDLSDLELSPRGSLGLVVKTSPLLVKNFTLTRIPPKE
jgi:hypothetical protein